MDKCSVLLAPTVLLCHQSNCLQSAVEPFWSLLPNCGTACLMISFWLIHCRPSPWTEALSVPAVLCQRCSVTVVQLCYCDTLSGPGSGNSYYKRNCWLIDWLIDWHWQWLRPSQNKSLQMAVESIICQGCLTSGGIYCRLLETSNWKILCQIHCKIVDIWRTANYQPPQLKTSLFGR